MITLKKYIKKLIKLINYEREAEIELMVSEIENMSGQKREELGMNMDMFHIIPFGTSTVSS